MADYFLGALKQIERRAENNILIFSDVLSERLDVIATNMANHVMSDNDYLKLFEMYYKKFLKEENKAAMLFCLLRMQQVSVLKKDVTLQSEVSNMEFNESYDVLTDAFLRRKRPYYQNMLNQYFKRFILIDTLVYILLLNLFVLLFHVPFKVMMLILLLLWLGVIFYADKKGKYRLYQMRMEELSKHVDLILLRVDQTVFSKVE